MPNKKNEPEFTVSDRRRFSVEGERRNEAPRDTEEENSAPRPAPVAENKPEGKTVIEPGRESAPGRRPSAAPVPPEPRPAPPTAAERAESKRAYQESTDALDEKLRHELRDQAVIEDFKAGFDRIVEPLYVTALVQLGFMGQESQTQRRVDIVGARQSIDALSLLQEKTKGNLTPEETALLEDVLYDIRMKYLEITNALARAVQNPPAGTPSGIGKA